MVRMVRAKVSDVPCATWSTNGTVGSQMSNWPICLANIAVCINGRTKMSFRLAHVHPKKVPTPTGATASSSTSAPVAPAPAAPTDVPTEIELDRENVMKFIFKNGTDYLKYLSELEQPLGDGALRMKALQEYKTNESTPAALAQIRDHQFTMRQTPSMLLQRVDIWDSLLPQLTFAELIDKLFTLKDLGCLNPDKRFAKKYVKALANVTKYHGEKVKLCPVSVFIKKRFYEKNIRYLAKTKKIHYAKKLEKRGIQLNESVIRQLSTLFEHTAGNVKRTPANYFIALDLRKSPNPSEYLLI